MKNINLYSYLGKNIRVTSIYGIVIEGFAESFTGRLDTEDELYDELTVETDDYSLICFNETEVESIEVIE